jgi:SM-20-related protein
MSDDDNELHDAPPCDECGSDEGALWCETCSTVLCLQCGAPTGKHAKHALGTIGASEDPYDYEDGAAGESDFGVAGDDGVPHRPTGVIQELITEEQAYHIVEMMESNAHISCRKLLLPRAQECLKRLLRQRQLPAPVSEACYGAGEPVRLSEEQWASLACNSYVVIDNFVPREVALEARQQTLELMHGGALTAYKNPMDVGRDDSVRSDLRLFLKANDQASPAAAGPLAEMVLRLEQLREALHEGIKLTGEQHEYQLAYYGAEGQHYKKHRDGFPNDGSRHLRGQVGRRITCTVYMNQFDSSHGGKLRIYVPDAGFNGESEVDIEPIAGRAVLFLSGAMDHEVLPSFAPRCAIAAWYS